MVDGKIKVDSLQPLFAKSDKKFTRKQILSSASIAANRAANERGVKYSKTAGYFKKVHVKERTGIESKCMVGIWVSTKLHVPSCM